MAGENVPTSRLRKATPERRRTRTYDVSNFGPLIDYLEQYLVPVGTIITKMTNASPGLAWVLIEGQQLSKEDFPELCDELGATFGETDTTFGLPDLSDTYLIGAGETAPLGSVGANGLTLAVENLPAHDHGITDNGHNHSFTADEHTHTVTDPGHTHGVTDPGHVHTASSVAAGYGTTGPDDGIQSSDTGSQTTGVSIDSATTGVTLAPSAVTGSISTTATGISVDETGGGQEFSIKPKSLSVYYFIKARA